MLKSVFTKIILHFVEFMQVEVSLTIKLKQLIDFEYIHMPNTVKLIK